jgi:hypothetical protein
MRQLERRVITGLAVAMVLTINGCTLNPSRADVLGRYELKGSDAGAIKLSLRGDGTYSESIISSSHPEDHRSGTWTLSGGSVNLSELWIPKEFAPDYILQADKRKSPAMPEYTEPGYWSLPAEKRWGVVFLTVFPDADIEFQRVEGN